MRSRRFVTTQSSERQPRLQEPKVAAASLLLLGLILGLIASLYYAWIVEPVAYTAAGPHRLADRYVEEYIQLVSQSYAVDQDWLRAAERLEELNDPALTETVTAQLEKYLRQGKTAGDLRSLALVAQRLGSQSPAISLFVPEQEVESPAASVSPAVIPTSTLIPTPSKNTEPTQEVEPTPTSTDIPQPTPVSAFRLLKQEKICRRNAPIPLIEVVLYDAFLEPIQGIEILVKWEDGEDHFFTGYHPEQGLGYGDFSMVPEVSYMVEVGIGSTIVEGLQVEECGQELGGFAGGWRLTFQVTGVSPNLTESQTTS